MNLPPYRLRVIDEKAALDRKMAALNDFIGSGDIFLTLDLDEQERLKEQLSVMQEYSEILGARISAFNR